MNINEAVDSLPSEGSLGGAQESQVLDSRNNLELFIEVGFQTEALRCSHGVLVSSCEQYRFYLFNMLTLRSVILFQCGENEAEARSAVGKKFPREVWLCWMGIKLYVNEAPIKAFGVYLDGWAPGAEDLRGVLIMEAKFAAVEIAAGLLDVLGADELVRL